MISKIETPSSDILGFSAKGTVTQEDYREQIEPALKKARQEGLGIRFLLQFGEEFKGFTPGAAWEDFRVGLQYLGSMVSCALVSDIGWIRNSSRFIGSFIPCPVRIFKNEELGDAIAWLNSGEIGLDHHLDTERKILTVEINGPLASENFEILANSVDPWIKEHKYLQGLVIHARKFPGWGNFGSMVQHIQFVKNHHRKIRKVAFSADGVLADLGPKISKHFVEAETKHFAYDELAAAQKWASEGA